MPMAEPKLHYGLLDGKLVSIDDVQRGLECNCVCPSCGTALIARKGAKREHHFAHASNINCTGGVETALHMLAKNLLFTYKAIFLPDIDKKNKGTLRQYQTAELECRDYGTFIPDAVLKNGSEVLAIEILVTHAVDEKKEEKIKEAQLPSLEIDLSDLIEHYNADTVMNAILSGENTRWIFNPDIARREKEKMVRDGLCDHLPSVCGVYQHFYKCPQLKHLVSITSHCNKCTYYYGQALTEIDYILKCSYRLRAVSSDTVSDIKNINRDKLGHFISADLLTDGNWINLAPKQDSSELFDGIDRRYLAGERLTSISNLKCGAVIVRNMVDETEWLIEVSFQGKLKRTNLLQNLVLGSRVTYDDQENKYIYANKEESGECIPDAGEQIWEIVNELNKE